MIFTVDRLGGARPSEMKYKSATISMFSQDLVLLYTQLLDRISHDHEQPHLHTATFIGHRGFTIISILQPVISTLRVLLESVISCRDTEFHDLSVVPALLRTHTLLTIVPVTSSYHQQSTDTISDLVQCLLAFTRPQVDLTKNKVSKSLWTCMLSDLLTYVSSSPSVLMPGLGLLSQLLPLPLPLPSTRSLTQEEEVMVSTSRKLWSAHLHPLTSQLSKLLAEVSSFSYPPMLSLLQKVGEQLSSLSPPIALVVVTAMVDNIKTCDPGVTMSRMMEFLVWCVTQPSMKTVTCDKMSSDVTFRTSVMATLDLGLASDQTQCQEATVKVIHCLCDPSITISLAEDQDQLLADSLPNKDTLHALVFCLLDHLAGESKLFSSQTSVFQTLEMMMDTRITADIVKFCLMTGNTNNKDKYLFSFLRKMAVEFSSSNSDLCTCSSSLLTFIHHLHPQDQDSVLSLAELSLSMGWICQDDSSQQASERRRTHPLVVLTNRIKESESEHADLTLTNTSVSISCSSKFQNIEYPFVAGEVQGTCESSGVSSS